VDPDSRIFQGDNVPRPEVPASHAVEDDVDPYAFPGFTDENVLYGVSDVVVGDGVILHVDVLSSL